MRLLLPLYWKWKLVRFILSWSSYIRFRNSCGLTIRNIKTYDYEIRFMPSKIEIQSFVSKIIHNKEKPISTLSRTFLKWLMVRDKWILQLVYFILGMRSTFTCWSDIITKTIVAQWVRGKTKISYRYKKSLWIHIGPVKLTFSHHFTKVKRKILFICVANKYAITWFPRLDIKISHFFIDCSLGAFVVYNRRYIQKI